MFTQRDNKQLIKLIPKIISSIRRCLLSVCSALIIIPVASADGTPTGLIAEFSGKDAAGWMLYPF